MPTERLTFPGAQGSTLAARLELPEDRAPTACAVFAHCFTCSKDSRAAVTISRSLAALGIAVLRFDFTGLGESDGEFGETTYTGSVGDVVAAAEFLASRFEAPALLIGHSLGGAVVLRAAAQLPSVQAVCTIGAPSDPGHALQLFGDTTRIESHGSAPVTIANRTFQVSNELVADLRDATLLDAVRSLNCALLIMHAPLDGVVSVSHAATLYTAAKHPKSFISLDQADHLLTQPGDGEYAAAVLVAWASRYLPHSAGNAESRADVGAQALARTAGTTGFRTEIVAGGHGLVVDEPIAVGGADSGPAPNDLISAALASCTTMTLQMYARRKGWPLQAAVARVSHSVVRVPPPAETAGETAGEMAGETADATVGETVSKPAPRAATRRDQFSREVELEGPLDGSQVERLLEIADKCPVHRLLERGAQVETTLRDR